jgi:hypothetical protein
MPRGSHTAHHPVRIRTSTRSRIRASARSRGTPMRRRGWVAAAGVVSLLVAAAMAAAGTRQQHQVQFTSSDATAPLLGVSASNPGPLAEATSEFGHMPIIRTYYLGLPDPRAWTTGAPGINKSAVVLSFQAPPATILSGADNAALSRFFDSAPTGHPIYYSYYDEPEPYITSGRFTLAEYKAAWAHIVALANAAHNPDLRSTLILMAWDLDPRSGIKWKDFLPSGGVISTLGWDAYPAGTVHDKSPQPTPPADFMGPAVAASKSVGLPFGFAEFALGTQNGRPAWLSEVASYLQENGALFGTLFNSSGFPWMELHDSASIQAWRSAVARSALDTPVAGPRTSPTPAPASTSTSRAPSSLRISGLKVSPATFAPSGANHVRITFTLTQRADIVVRVLGSNGAVLRQLAKPNHPAGSGTIWWYGHDEAGHLLRAGRYPVLVVASSGHGSATAETVVTVTAP